MSKKRRNNYTTKKLIEEQIDILDYMYDKGLINNEGYIKQIKKAKKKIGVK